MKITGTDIKAQLAKNNLTKLWLLNQLTRKGHKMSMPTLSAILSDSYQYKDKGDAVIKDAAEILEKYEAFLKEV